MVQSMHGACMTTREVHTCECCAVGGRGCWQSVQLLTNILRFNELREKVELKMFGRPNGKFFASRPNKPNSRNCSLKTVAFSFNPPSYQFMASQLPWFL
jgi:hypothetical protein